MHGCWGFFALYISNQRLLHDPFSFSFLGTSSKFRRIFHEFSAAQHSYRVYSALARLVFGCLPTLSRAAAIKRLSTRWLSLHLGCLFASVFLRLLVLLTRFSVSLQ